MIGRAVGDGGISLALSSSGAPTVAYTAYSNEGYVVGYARLEAGGWQTTVAAAQATGPALALDAGNNPHILFFSWDAPNNTAALYYTRWDNSGWVTEQVDHERPISSVSLRLDAAGQPHFAGHSRYDDRWVDGLPPLDGYAWYGWRDAAGWHIDPVSVGGAYPDLAWGPDASLSVAYLQGDASLDLARSGPYGGWTMETADRQELLSGPIALAVDRQGQPQVAYKGHDVYHAALAAGGWQPEVVFSSATEWQTLAVDSLGQPHMAAVERRRPPQSWVPYPWSYILWYADVQGGAWQRSLIAEFGFRPVIAIDTADRVHLAYTYSHPYSHPEGMDSELIYQLDGQSSLNVKAYAFASLSMAVDSQGNPHIVDMNDNYRITYRVFDGAAWHAESVGPDAEAPRFDAQLALDAAERPAVAYVENLPALSTRVLFATRKPAGWTIETVLQEDFGEGYVAGDGVGEEIRLAFDTAGAPHVVFVRDRRLQHGWRGAAGWQFETIDGAALPAAFDLVAGPDGRLLVAYVDALSNDARLAQLRVRPSALFLPLILR